MGFQQISKRKKQLQNHHRFPMCCRHRTMRNHRLHHRNHCWIHRSCCFHLRHRNRYWSRRNFLSHHRRHYWRMHCLIYDFHRHHSKNSFLSLMTIYDLSCLEELLLDELFPEFDEDFAGRSLSAAAASAAAFLLSSSRSSSIDTAFSN